MRDHVTGQAAVVAWVVGWVMCLWASQAAAQSFTLNAVGDVSLPHGGFNRVIDRQGPALFDDVRGLIGEGDLNFVNVETPVTRRTPTDEKKYAFAMPPERLKWVTDAGFNLISLANNHITDAGTGGVHDSIKAIEALHSPERPLYWSGISLDASQRFKPTLMTIKGVRVAFFATGFDRSSRAYNPKSPVHQVRDEGFNEAIAKVRAEVDVVLVSAHFGREYQHTPGPDALRFYHGYIDAGADLVIGHHPHVLRGVEKYKGGVILHSLGNFSFASRTVRHRKSDAKLYSMIAQVEFDAARPVGQRVKRVALVPLFVNNTEPWTLNGETLPRQDFGPRVLKGAFAQAVLQALDGWSQAIPGNLARVRAEGDIGVVTW